MRRIATALVLLFVLTGCAGRHEIVSSLKEKEANEIIVFLASYGIDAEKTATSTGAAGGGADQEKLWSITVPTNQATDALALLNKAGLPRRPGPSLLSLFPKSGLVSSAQEEQIRYQEGLAEQIAGTIRMIDGVTDAVVQISFPVTEATVTGTAERVESVRASVYVKHTGILDDPNSQLITKIKRLVAASVVGLEYANVTVVADRARYADISLDHDAALLPDDEMEYERVWSITVWKGSVNRFQTTFIILILAVLILAAFIAWILWKLFPALQQAGGVSKLFTSIKPIYPEGYTPPKKKKKGEEEEEEEYEEEGEE